MSVGSANALTVDLFVPHVDVVDILRYPISVVPTSTTMAFKMGAYSNSLNKGTAKSAGSTKTKSERPLSEDNN